MHTFQFFKSNLISRNFVIVLQQQIQIKVKKNYANSASVVSAFSAPFPFFSSYPSLLLDAAVHLHFQMLCHIYISKDFEMYFRNYIIYYTYI